MFGKGTHFSIEDALANFVSRTSRDPFKLGPLLGVRDITGIPVYRNLGVPRFVSRYAFDCTSTLGKLRQFSEHGLAAFVLSCIFTQISFFI